MYIPFLSNLFYNKQIFHACLFNIKNYSPEVINIQEREVQYYVNDGE